MATHVQVYETAVKTFSVQIYHRCISVKMLTVCDTVQCFNDHGLNNNSTFHHDSNTSAKICFFSCI